MYLITIVDASFSISIEFGTIFIVIISIVYVITKQMTCWFLFSSHSSSVTSVLIMISVTNVLIIIISVTSVFNVPIMFNVFNVLIVSNVPYF